MNYEHRSYWNQVPQGPQNEHTQGKQAIVVIEDIKDPALVEVQEDREDDPQGVWAAE